MFYCNDEKEAKKYFHMSMFPKEVPVAIVIDPKRREPLKKAKDPREVIQAKETRPLSEGSRPFKHTGFVHPN